MQNLMTNKKKDIFAAKVDSLLSQVRVGNKSALNKLQRVCQKKPNHPYVLNALACLALEKGDGDRAAVYLQKALDKNYPNSTEILRNQLIASAMSGDLESFDEYWLKIENERPNLSSKIEPIKSAYKVARYSKHADVLDRVLQIWSDLTPDDTYLLLSRIAIKLDRDDTDQASNLIEQLPEIDETEFSSLMLACELCDRAKNTKSFEYLEKAYVALDKSKPNDIQRLIHMAIKLNEFKVASTLLEELVDSQPDLYESKLYDMLNIYQKSCQWDKAENLVPDYLDAVATDKIKTPGLWQALSFPGLTDTDHLLLANSYVSKFESPPSPPSNVFQRQPRQNRRLKVGYLSADFKNHPVAQLLVEIIEQHDSDKFETFAYDLAEESLSLYRQRILEAFDNVIHVRSFTNDELIQQIRNDNIDILVDLQGDTSDSRFLLFRHRLAPIQVNWLGYAGTTGQGISDYIIADKHVIPENSFPHFAEAPVWLPDTYIPNDPQREPMPVPPRVVHGLPDDALVFCCFNGQYKITKEIFHAWCDILFQVPNSILWLRYESNMVKKHFISVVKSFGIDPDRLIFAPRTQYQVEHLTRLQCADIALDTRPYNSHTTCIDALWAGLPIITLPGDTFASRVASSILNVVELQELIASDIQDYVRIAVDLAQDTKRIKELRQYLIQSRNTSPLFDSLRFTRNLEAAYEAMFARFELGLEPAPITDLQSPISNYGTTKLQSSIQLALERAESFLKNEKTDKARELFQYVFEKDSNNAQALNGLGLIHALHGRYDEAIGLLEQAISQAPDVEHYQINLARVKEKQVMDHAANLSSKLLEAQNYHSSGQLDKAMSLYGDILELSPKHPVALHYYGLLQVQQGDPSGLENMLVSLKIQPHNENFLKNYQKAKSLIQTS